MVYSGDIGKIVFLVQFCVSEMHAKLLFLDGHLSVTGQCLFTLFTLSVYFLCLQKSSGRMYSHIANYAAYPTLPLIILSVDESSAHRLPYWYLATQGAGTGQSSFQN